MARTPRPTASADAEGLAIPRRDYSYLTAGEVVELHAHALRQTWEQSEAMLLGGGLEKLEGALARPEHYAHYENADLAAQAAALAQGIVEAHAFQDGNKRVAAQAFMAFLVSNGRTVSVSKRTRANWMIALATGAPADQIASEIRASLAPLP